jgi:FtsP/CotA-like multicopper oxidase with cupredoxin domain
MIDRRRFLATGVALSVLPFIPLDRAMSQTPPVAALRIVKRAIDVNGKSASVFGLLGPDGRPGLSFAAGERFAVRLVNETKEATIIHWHGLTPPWQQDGVADFPLPLIGAGATRNFDFPLQNAGTNWMHAHTLQEQTLLAAPLIIKESTSSDEQDVVVLLHDFSFKSPEELLEGLTQKGGQMGGGSSGQGGMVGMNHGGMGGMSGSGVAMDVNDIDYDAYLANDRTLNDPETIRVEKGGRVRLRVINGATATVFTLDLGALPGELVAVDGQPVRPVRSRRFPLAMGQRLDVRLPLPSGAGSYPILFLREGARERAGVVLATQDAPVAKLAPTADATGPVMSLDLEAALLPATSLAVRSAEQRVTVDLVGGMMGYQWGLRGLEQPLVVKTGQRVEVTMANRSMMGHPMHLHGHHFEVVAINGRRVAGAVRDTVHLPPMTSVTIAFDADNAGKWAFHCHHLYHMATGMMGFVHYAEVG